MTRLSDELLKQAIPPQEQSDYRYAMNALRAISEIGYDTEVNSTGRRGCSISINGNRQNVVHLLLEAVKQVDPHGVIYFDPAENLMRVEFDAKRFEKPPVRMVSYVLDYLKDHLLSRCTRNEQGDYVVLQPEGIEFDVLDYVHGLAESGQSQLYYTLPGETPLTGQSGHTYLPGQRVPSETMLEFVHAHPGMADVLMNQEPCQAVISPETMQRALDQLEAGGEKGMALN